MLDNETLVSFQLPPSDPSFLYSEVESISAGIVTAIQSICGTILNFLVILALIRSEEIRKEYFTPTIISIAIANFIHSIYTLPILSCYFFMSDMPITDCQFFSFIGLGIWFCSAWNLLGFSVLRCLSVYFPEKCNGNTFKNIGLIFPIISWIISFIFFTPILLRKTGQFGLECMSLTCRYINIDTEGKTIKNGIDVVMITLLIIIGVVILILNVATFTKISKKIQKVTNEEKGADFKIASKILQKEKKMGVMLACLSVLYFLVYCPSFVLNTIDPYARFTKTTASIICNLMNWSIGVLDPLVYVVCQKRYRKEIIILLQSIVNCGKRNSRVESNEQIMMHRIVQKSNNMVTLETVRE